MHFPRFVSCRGIPSLIIKVTSLVNVGRLLKHISCPGSLTRDEKS